MDGTIIIMSDIKYPDVEVPLSNEDGNAVIIISRVARAIKYQYGDEAVEDFKTEARKSKSYDELLQFIMGTVETS